MQLDLITSGEPVVGSEISFDTIVVEDGKANWCFSDTVCTDEGDWCASVDEGNHPLDQFFASDDAPCGGW